jgi:hypothetical protein
LLEDSRIEIIVGRAGLKIPFVTPYFYIHENDSIGI